MLSRLPAEERRVQLVQAALARAEQDGIGSVTIRRVAEDAGVSLGVVHYCFENKEELMSAAIETIVTDLSGALRNAFAQAGDAARGDRGAEALREMLRAGIRGMWQLIENTANVQLLTYEITTYALRGGSEESRGLATRQYEFNTAEATTFLRDCAARTGTRWIRPVEHVARLSLSVIDGIVLRWLVDRDSEAALAQFDDVLELVVGLAAPAE
ncbi:TetR family transcriptional regulator [Rhodococcus sp. D2-41]|uniref:TetR family transcriptional regulator n=1 Tax=Speluncibacter jeojiensis TaxID=2710754 RepID=A0A9X4LZW8_9ACTN|nr:TetR/AcrR family transcriptional regulator [Rhodococcus sp. D2-41]MDG3012544.1 TetR family transcriptional regulator [Rhodococcus sp. D2-41]MDG3015339.1 TetR family transcriptional regulator [Corynebacteriales bacterium D3-21]